MGPSAPQVTQMRAQRALLADADQALYRAKRAGRNRVVVAGAAPVAPGG